MKEIIKIKSIRTQIKCPFCGEESYTLEYMTLSQRKWKYCRSCQKAVSWQPVYHIVFYEEIEDEGQDNE